MKTCSDIRSSFLNFFNQHNHSVVASSSLVPENDPTLLFSNAGMNQFKNVFLGSERRPYSRATSCQKCLRISGKHNDLENVGVTARHHTFFEMLGNFSFGDYFKAEAIEYAWELVTKVWGIPENRLWVTVFEKDDEAAKLWSQNAGVSKERILRCGEADNFWAMGDTGPCGPCTELHVYLGTDLKAQSEAGFRKEDGSYLEFWNLVFMQYDRDAKGNMTPLPKPCVDTGAGLERVTAIVNQFPGNYNTDTLRPIISRCEELSGFRYDGSSYAIRDLRNDQAYARDVAMRVIADHSRAVAFLIADGVHPASDGRGYVLRRVLRRAVRHGRVLGLDRPFLQHATDTVVAALSSQYPELLEKRDLIRRVVTAEEEKFGETLEQGLSVLQKEADRVPKGGKFSGQVAFLLHDTFGFPLDLTQDALKSYSLSVDTTAFDAEMTAQRSRSREDRASRGITFASQKASGKPTTFIGYTELACTSKISAAYPAEDRPNHAPFQHGDEVALFFESTPFYAESGGQVADTGSVRFKDGHLRVLDVQKVQNEYFQHICVVEQGELPASPEGLSVELVVDDARRAKIRANHSATHLIHMALRQTLGSHIKQAGSRVDDHTLRFDFTHFEPLTYAQLNEIEQIANSAIRANNEVVTRVLPIDEARKTGAVALFGEKYGERVRVVEIGPQSVEFCGGTHVTRSGDIGVVLTRSETGVSAGVRRIECVSAEGAWNEMREIRALLGSIAGHLKVTPAGIEERITRLQAQLRELEREGESARARMASSAATELLAKASTTVKGHKLIAAQVERMGVDTLKTLVDNLRAQLGSGIVALISVDADGANLVAGATSDLNKKVHVGNIVKEAAAVSGGKGGGRPDFAQAGGLSPEKVGLALTKIRELVE